MTHEEKFKEYQSIINTELDQRITKEKHLQSKIFEAMRYSLNAGGKRIRPILVLEFAKIFGASIESALPFACAIEMVHTYSLIHDDLPCMDDDTMRRGRPTNHIVYGEAVAVLAGDALLNCAFETILRAKVNIPEERIIRAARVLADASGAYGMIGGQVIDMEGEKRSLELSELQCLHKLKTGALITAAAEMGCIIAGVIEGKINKAKNFSEYLGFAFQMKDDILNVEGDAAIMGKSVGNDEKSGKSTFVKLLGLSRSKELLNELTDSATDSLSEFPDNEFLIWLTKELSGRNC